MRKIYMTSLFLALLAGRPVTVTAAVSLLGEAADAPELPWETYGDALWTPQTAVTHDGLDAAQSGAFLDGASTLHTYVTGPGTVSFWWKVSAETNIDAFRFYVGGEVLAQISGSVDWEQRTFAVPEGTQELKWKFKDRGTIGQDRGWVDQVQFAGVPATITRQPASRTVDAGTRSENSSLVTLSLPGRLHYGLPHADERPAGAGGQLYGGGEQCGGQRDQLQRPADRDADPPVGGSLGHSGLGLDHERLCAVGGATDRHARRGGRGAKRRGGRRCLQLPANEGDRAGHGELLVEGVLGN